MGATPYSHQADGSETGTQKPFDNSDCPPIGSVEQGLQGTQGTAHQPTSLAYLGGEVGSKDSTGDLKLPGLWEHSLPWRPPMNRPFGDGAVLNRKF